jgi:hypothetical protein
MHGDLTIMQVLNLTIVVDNSVVEVLDDFP